MTKSVLSVGFGGLSRAGSYLAGEGTRRLGGGRLMVMVFESAKSTAHWSKMMR